MISKLIIRTKTEEITIHVMSEHYADISPEIVWDDIKDAIRYFKTNNKEISPNSFIHLLLTLNKYYKSDINENISYYMYLDFYSDIVVFTAYHSGNINQGIICYENRYVIDDKNEGNCIDDFIKKGVNPQIDNINDLVNSIKKRLPERQVTDEYHSTWCFEKDFTEISLIKKFAQKIVDNCNKHLERISEFYTKNN